MSQWYVGADIGGTKVASVVVDESGKVRGESSVPSQATDRPIVDTIVHGMELALSDARISWGEVAAIGLGAPGNVDPGKGLWWGSTNLRLAHAPLSLTEEIERRTGRPAFADNDVKAGGLGEYHFGLGRTLEDPSHAFLYINFGTGLAASLIIGKELFRGRRDAGEIGHVPVAPDGYPCNCGQRGCLETLASGRAFIRWGREALDAGWAPRLLELCEGDPGRLSGRHILQAAQEGDRVSLELTDRLARGVALAIVMGLRVFDPHLVALGGGVITGGGTFLLDRVQAELAKLSPRYTRGKTIKPAELGENAGPLGAAAVALNRMGRVLH